MTGQKSQQSKLKIAVFFILTVFCGLLLITLWFGLALEQEEPVSRIAIVLAAAKIELNKSDLVPLGPNVWLKRAYKNGVPQWNDDAIDKLAESHGWKQTGEEGEERIYTKGKSELQIYCRMHSGHYQVCRASGPL